jgi:PST family polysaccharide transporter
VGVGPALIQREHLSSDEMKTGFVLSLISGLLIAVSLWIIAPFAAVFFAANEVEPILKALSLGFIVDGFAVLPDSLIQRHLRFREIMAIENASYVLGIAAVGISLALLGFGVWSLVYAHLAMKSIRLAMLLRFERIPSGGVFRLEHARSLIQMGFGFSLGRILNFTSLQGDNFVVGRLLGVTTLGMYTRAYQLMALPAMYIGQVLERVLFPAMAKRQSDPRSLTRAYQSTLEVVTLAALPASIVMYYLGEEIVAILFGASWVHISPIVSTLSFGVFFRTAYKCSDTLVRSLGAVYQYAVRQFIYSLVVVIGSILGGQMFGLQGVAVAVVAAVAVNYLLLTRLAMQHLAMSLEQIVQPHLPGVWISAWIGIALAIATQVARSYELSSLVVLTIGLTISGVVGILALLLAPSAVRVVTIPYALQRLQGERIGGLGRLALRFFS